MFIAVCKKIKLFFGCFMMYLEANLFDWLAIKNSKVDVST
jgi:hypothetical protein